MAAFRLENENNQLDEVMQYRMGRYINSNEAVWRIFNFKIHERYPSVVHLSVHLENGHRVHFVADNARERAAKPSNTTMTVFFQLCQEDSFARTLLYPEGAPVPGYHNLRAADAIGRMYTETCQRLGMLESDEQWDTTMSKASLSCFAAQLRRLFAITLTTCAPSNPQKDICVAINGQSLSQLGLPPPSRNNDSSLDGDNLRERNYDVNEIMGGLTVILAGDFRLTLPIISRSTPVNELNACIIILSLNARAGYAVMRVHLFGEAAAGNFAQQLLCLGGRFPTDPTTDLITFPTYFCNLVQSVEELVAKVFPDIGKNFKSPLAL
ncbi:unnamed protein product [Strongylus vulgaris]|uniref:DNA helicase n=1 Tax=Strongylus vulgaris TaxID=40348 RepID=A0A3P7IGQ2_STRVU|nr:unnamed protein product [Strongylus vulgaris]